MPMTSHTTYSAGSLRRRIVALPVACSACAIHSEVQRLAEQLEARRSVARANGEQCRTQLHPRPASTRTRRTIERDAKKIQSPVTYALSDQHCG
jgi:hypothetical protein